MLFKPVVPNFLRCKFSFFVWTRYWQPFLCSLICKNFIHQHTVKALIKASLKNHYDPQRRLTWKITSDPWGCLERRLLIRAVLTQRPFADLPSLTPPAWVSRYVGHSHPLTLRYTNLTPLPTRASACSKPHSFVFALYKERCAKLELNTMKGATLQNKFCNIAACNHTSNTWWV